MALFKGAKQLESTKEQYYRTNTKLQHSVHDAPPEKFLIDPRLPRLFRYHFGGDGWVVIPKGRAVAPATDDGGIFKNGMIKDFDSDVYRPVLTLANGGKDVTEIGKDGKEYVRKANKAIGLAYANLYEELIDGFNGMQPTVENEIYVELPYIPRKEDAEETEWGCFYDVNPEDPVKAGDYVMSDENGRLIKADFDAVRKKAEEATTIAELREAVTEEMRLRDQVLGQVWAVETNLPPHGWLKWVGWTDEQRADMDNPSGMTAQDIMDNEFPGYPYEKTYRNFDVKSNRYYPQGIPGLTDGSNIEVPFEDVVIGQINPGQSGRHDFRIQQHPIVEGTLEVKIDGEVVEPAHVDYKTGLVTIMADENTGETPQAVTASFKATGQIPGVPTGWDFKGSVGAVRILLQK